MPTNDFLAFGTGVGSNVESQADYSVDTKRTLGQQPGVASSAFNNKALRQACWIASVLAQFIANTSGDDVLDDANQSNLLASMASTWPGATAPTLTKLTTTGSTTGYLFTVSTANATVGAVYANNTQTFTVLATLSSGTQLFCSATGAPLSSGTLTKQSGTGDSTITFSDAQALATYTTPANVKYLKIKQVGGGGGGAGGGVGNGSVGSDGSATAFGAGLLICNGGAGGSTGTNHHAKKGSASLGGASGIAITGGTGGNAGIMSTTASYQPGSSGAASPFGGQGGGAPGDDSSDAGDAASANSGSGGGGGSTFAANSQSGGGGDAGGYIDALIPSPAATYVYCVGSGGSGGSAGTSGSSGGNGGSGLIYIEEHYGS